MIYSEICIYLRCIHDVWIYVYIVEGLSQSRELIYPSPHSYRVCTLTRVCLELLGSIPLGNFKCVINFYKQELPSLTLGA
jgi:hypothetical protein